MDRARFYAALRRRDSGVFGTKLTQEQVYTLDEILDRAVGWPRSWIAYAMATAYHETGGKMAPNRENLNYRTAERLREVWPRRFPTLAAAAPYVRNPRGLANLVYNGRLGNRVGSDDGWNFRGGGLSHLTGRDNYARASQIVGVDLVADPELLLKPSIAVAELLDGMATGRYRGPKLEDFDRAGGYDFVGARAIVNADVKANGERIARHARVFDRALSDAGMASVAPRIVPARPVAAKLTPRPPAPAPAPTSPPTAKRPGAVSGGIAALILAGGAAMAAKWSEVAAWFAGWWPL